MCMAKIMRSVAKIGNDAAGVEIFTTLPPDVSDSTSSFLGMKMKGWKRNEDKKGVHLVHLATGGAASSGTPCA